MKKRYLLFCQLALLPTLAVRAQFTTGTEGFYIQSNTDVYIDGVFMTPSIPVDLTSQTLIIENEAPPGTPPGISRIYRFTSPFDFSGLVGFHYQNSELNGNPAGSLELFYGDGNNFTSSTGSDNSTANQISNSLSSVNFSALTAGQSSALPVTLASFYLHRSENVTTLSWQTIQEENSDFFEIQQSADARNWSTLGQVRAAGRSERLASYSFTDAGTRQGLQYYRIKMVDRDGTYDFSPIRSIRIGDTDQISAFPNPASDRLYINAGEPVSSLKLSDLSGRKILEVSNPDRGVNLSTYPTGVYLAEIVTQSGARKVIKVLKK